MDKQDRSKVQRINGFTLIELLVVIAIVLVLSAIAVPVYSQWMNNQEYRTTARSVFHALREARSMAVATCFEYRVEFDAVNRRYRVVRGNRGFNSNDWNTVIYDWMQCPPGVNFNANVKAIHLNPKGTANAGTISIQDGMHETRFEVRVARTGRIRIPTF
jgi:type II secretion system protein H